MPSVVVTEGEADASSQCEVELHAYGGLKRSKLSGPAHEGARLQQ